MFRCEALLSPFPSRTGDLSASGEFSAKRLAMLIVSAGRDRIEKRTTHSVHVHSQGRRRIVVCVHNGAALQQFLTISAIA
jgi:hypothetical protein